MIGILRRTEQNLSNSFGVRPNATLVYLSQVYWVDKLLTPMIVTFISWWWLNTYDKTLIHFLFIFSVIYSYQNHSFTSIMYVINACIKG